MNKKTIDKQVVKKKARKPTTKEIRKGVSTTQESGGILEDKKIILEDKTTKDNLTAKQELFCQYYVTQEFFANGVQSYGNAYGIEPKDLLNPKSKQYQVAVVNSSKMLRNTKVLKRINDLLDLNGLNDEFVDKQLTFLITQNDEFSSKLGAIKEYNKLKKRLEDKLKIEIQQLPPVEYK